LFRGWPGLFKRRLARRVRRRLSPPSQPGELPSVSIIVTGHSGSEGLKRLLAGLQNHTDYPDYEVVLVEPGSAEVADPFAEASGAKVVAGGSPAEDKNRGARAASADLLLFINDGVEPFESGWLRELMACVIPPGTGAAAAYPLPTPMEKSVLMAWYRGLRFRRADGEEHPKASRQGEDTLGEDVQCPASPSDCLLVWRQAFEAAGGFSWGYRDGGEDVELGIRLLSAGYGTVSSGKSVVLREAPQGGYIGEEDRRLLFERRGPLLHRSIKLDRLNVGGFWSQSAAHLAIAGDENHEFNGSGWRISRVTDDLRSVPPDADYALSLNPELPLSRLSETTTIAWVRDRVEYWISRPHFERYDAVLAASEEIRDVVEAETCKAAHPFPEANGEQLAEILRERANSLSFCIKTGIPNWKNARHWGDLHFARALQRQLERLGHPCLVQTAGEWDGPRGLQYDVSIHLRGRGPCSPKPGQLNVLWSISRPGELTPEECDLHDLVFVASKRLAEHLMGKTSTPVFALEQATDPGTFFPDHDPAHDREVVFVGNSRNVERRILADLLPTGRDLAVWGRNWRKFIDEKYIVGEYLPNKEVRKAYSSAAIVLNDHWDDMREHGFVSNRIYDALACGAFIISDHLPELGEEFDGAVATYRTPRQLEGLIDYYLDHPREREERGRHGREIVLSRHTFDHRAEELLHRIQERLEDPEIKRRLHNLP
jgi:glycosyltransferase involved in cell wall biosynthesis